MVVQCGTRTRCTRLITHLVSGDLAGGVEVGGASSDCFSHGVVDFVRSTRVIDTIIRFWSIQRFNDKNLSCGVVVLRGMRTKTVFYHQQRRGNSYSGR
jgi:hypothetical protein